LILPEEPATYVVSRMSLYRFLPLSVQISHAVQVCELPNHHDDPFGRLLIAQSQIEGMPLITADKEIRRYKIKAVW